MDDAVYFVREPPIVRLDGGNVYVEVVSGDRVFRFEATVNTFLATFAVFGRVAHEWRGGGAEIIPLADHAASL